MLVKQKEVKDNRYGGNSEVRVATKERKAEKVKDQMELQRINKLEKLRSREANEVRDTRIGGQSREAGESKKIGKEL